MSDGSPLRLSTDGEARRDAMLDHLVRVVSARHRNRHRRRRRLAAGGIFTALIVLVLLAYVDGRRPARFAGPLEDPRKSASFEGQRQVRRSPGCETLVVQTSTSVLARYQASTANHTVRINDGTLLEMLAAMGRPAELIHKDGRTRLSVPVTDAELRDQS